MYLVLGDTWLTNMGMFKCDKQGDSYNSDKHSSGLSFVKLLVANRHIVSF